MSAIYIKVRELFSNGISYALMKLFGRFMIIRQIVRAVSNKAMEIISRSESFTLIDKEKLLNDLTVNGFSRDIIISSSAKELLEQYAYNNPVHAYMDKDLEFFVENRKQFEDLLGKEILVAHYPNLHRAEIFENISNDPVLNSIAKKYCGNSAKCIASQMWWTFPAKVSDEIRSEYAHFYHRDLDGYNFIKFFIYLTDVHKGDGGHFFVSRSHTMSILDGLKERFRISRIPDDVVRSRFGKDAIVEMIGPSGTVIVEDTFGLHKGQTPTKQPRLMASFVFGTKNYNDIQRYMTSK